MDHRREDSIGRSPAGWRGTLAFLAFALALGACGDDSTVGGDDLGAGEDASDAFALSDGPVDAAPDRADLALSDAMDATADARDANTMDADAMDADMADATDATDGSPDILVLAPNGNPCSEATECASGQCRDGVCCDASCDGTCESCLQVRTGAGNGVCAPITANTDPEDECSEDRCETGLCDGEGACGLRPNGTECRASAGACDTAEQCLAGVCPDDALREAGAICRESTGPCDEAERCSGDSPACDADGFRIGSADGCGLFLCGGSGANCPTTCADVSDCMDGPLVRCEAGSCIRGKAVFITRAEVGPDLGGLAGADALCQAEAEGAGLTGTFRAWLSTGATSVADRFVRASVPYVRTDGTLLASNWGDLTDGTLNVSIDHFADGMDILSAGGFNASLCWTGTAANGSNRSGGAVLANCQNWTSAAAADRGAG
ncbi:MAG: hypothetical protein AAF411_30370, partial [Myxococcota bacterium]